MIYATLPNSKLHGLAVAIWLEAFYNMTGGQVWPSRVHWLDYIRVDRVSDRLRS